MEIRKVTAIIRPEMMDKVERKLHAVGVPGMSISQVKGYGEYADMYRSDWMITHARVEVFIEAERADELALAIMEVCYTGCEGDGIVAISPVESMFHIRTKKKCMERPC